MAKKKILDNPDYQKIILEKIELSGFQKNVWLGICSETTFYEYLELNTEFAESLAQAKERWRKTIWKERPDLRRLAIEGLEKNLKDYQQIMIKEEYAIVGEKRILIRQWITKWQKPPAKWAIEAILGMNLDVEDTEDLETTDFEWELVTKENFKKFSEN